VFPENLWGFVTDHAHINFHVKNYGIVFVGRFKTLVDVKLKLQLNYSEITAG